MSFLHFVSFMYCLCVFEEKHIFAVFGLTLNLLSRCGILGDAAFFLGFLFSFEVCGYYY